jgi:hypothetical protein
LLAAFSQVYTGKLEQEAEHKDLKILQFDQKSPCKVRVKEGMVAEETRAIKNKPCSLYWDNRKDDLRSSWDSSGSQPSQAEGYKSVNSLKSFFSLDENPSVHPAHPGLSRKLFPHDLIHHACHLST